MISHSGSLINGVLMQPIYHTASVLLGALNLMDQQWVFIQPLLPSPARTGRPRLNDRRTTEGILNILITGCRWQDLPRECGTPTTVWRRLIPQEGGSPVRQSRRGRLGSSIS